MSSFKVEGLSKLARLTLSTLSTERSGTASVSSTVLAVSLHSSTHLVLVGNANVSFDDHPWPLPLSATPPMKDFSHGVCRFYQGWLLGHQSTREPQGESSEALKSEDLSKDTVTPGLAPAQPAEVTEISTCQTVPTVAPKATIKYDPALPFAQQAKVAAPTKTESDSRTASLATKTVAEMASSPVNSTGMLSWAHTGNLY